MVNRIAVSVKSVSKSFKLPHDRSNSIKGALINLGRKKSYEKQQVLKDISFDIKEGEFFGIVGRNGSGKSTLLKLLAGIYVPDKGQIDVNGKLTPFIELGVGFNPELTGRENIFLNGALLGFSRKEMMAMYDDIVSFAELERFMDQKLKNYSSGMQVRLAFSIAIRAKSDVLVLDEVLAVGDAAFQAKCFDYFYELKRQKATVVFVSHDRTSLERFCTRGVLIDKGEIIEIGDIKKVLKKYSSVVLNELDHEDVKKAKKRATAVPMHAKIERVRSMRRDDTMNKRFIYGEPIRVGFDVVFMQNLRNPVFGVTVWQKNVTSKPVFADNTVINGTGETGEFKAGDRVTFSVTLPEGLNDGEFYIEPAVANESGTTFYDQVSEAARFYVDGSKNPYALLSADEPARLEKR